MTAITPPYEGFVELSRWFVGGYSPGIWFVVDGKVYDDPALDGAGCRGCETPVGYHDGLTYMTWIGPDGFYYCEECAGWVPPHYELPDRIGE